MKKNKLMIAVFLFPALLCFGLIYVYPTIRTVIMSFYNVKNITDYSSEWTYVGVKNYVLLSESEVFKTSLLNIGWMWFWGGIGVMAIALLFAVILSSTNIRFKAFFRSVIYLPNIVAAVAMGMVWMQYVFNSQFGLLKTIFEKIGLKNLSEFQWTAVENIRLSMTIAFCFGIVGFYMLIYMAAMEKIPDDYYEAATLEGANTVKKFFKITLPLMRNVFRTTLVLWSTTMLGYFTWSMIFSPTNVAQLETVTPMVYMNNIVFTSDFNQISNTALKNAGTGGAIGVIVTCITVVVFFLVTTLIKEDNLEY